MTTLIQQKSDNDCTLAAIAMLAGKERWEDLWTPEDLGAVIQSGGVGDHDPWLLRAGFKPTEYAAVYCYGVDSEALCRLLKWRRALLSVRSLNNNGGHHMVYWDGVRLYDPQEGVEGKLAFRWLSSCAISRAWVFDDRCITQQEI